MGFAALVLSAGVLASCTANHDARLEHPATRPAPSPANYAYATSHELVVMRGDETVARVRRLFDEADPSFNKVVWSNSGRYVALLSDATLRHQASSTEVLISVDVATGKARRVPCPGCTDLTPVRANAILVEGSMGSAARSRRYQEIDLSSPRAPTTVGANNAFLPWFLTSTADSVITAEGSFAGSVYQQHLVVTKPDGTFMADLGEFPSNEYMEAAASSGSGDRETRVAVGFRPDAGECMAEFPVLVVVLSNGHARGVATDMSAAEPPGHASGVPGGLEVNDLAWGADGQLHATIASWTCDESKPSEDAKMTVAHHSASWRLDGSKWVSEGSEHVTAARDLEPNTKIVLDIPDCIGHVASPDPVVYCNTGRLSRVHDGTRTQITDHAILISTPDR